jgi:hypothetical protein
MFECVKCGEKFKTKQGLKGHVQFKHSDFVKIKMKKKIILRKEEEEKNKWLGVRGNSDIFYLDFEDLGKIIIDNWDIYSKYFPDQAWIVTKIKELVECRNLVAHNSFIEEHQKNVIKLNYASILKQLEKTLNESN